jgi:hypothetical protein
MNSTPLCLVKDLTEINLVEIFESTNEWAGAALYLYGKCDEGTTVFLRLIGSECGYRTENFESIAGALDIIDDLTISAKS